MPSDTALALEFTISKQFHFSASHQLTHLPDGHPCARMHGHNYVVVVLLQGGLDERGFVVDYNDLALLKEFIDSNWDHRHLNDYFDGDPRCTTAENLAAFLFGKCAQWWPQTVAVWVAETDKTRAEARRTALDPVSAAILRTVTSGGTQ